MKNLTKANLLQTLVYLVLMLGSCGPSEEVKEMNIKDIIGTHAQNLLDDTNAFATSISITKNGKTYTTHFGEIDKGKANKITDTTLFEIASVTKVFTGTLMARAVVDGKINLDDDIRKFLPGSYPNLEFQGQPIKVKDLLGFKSGINQKFPDVSHLRAIEDDSTAFRLEAFGASYNKSHFFEDLEKVKLDTFPGTTYYYNELCPELTGYILEKVYQKDFRKIMKDELFDELEMNSTFFTTPDSKSLLNGYNINEKLMPNFAYRIWGAGGMLKSTISDLNKFLRYHLKSDNKVIMESHRNIENSISNWKGYLWDDISVTRNGLRCLKHGGGYGVQNMFVVYPEQNLGITIVINQSAPNTHEKLMNTINTIVADLSDPEQDSSETYGYRIENETIVFQYTHPEKLDYDLINSISVAGTFNDWNPNNDMYQMNFLEKGIYELSIPLGHFQQVDTHEFRFVINENSWLTVPQNIPNRTYSKRHNNITLVID